MVVQGFISERFGRLLVIYLQGELQGTADLLQDQELVCDVGHVEDIVKAGHTVQIPAVEPKKYNKIQIEPGIVNLELPPDGQPQHLHTLHKIGHIPQHLIEGVRQPHMLVLIALDRKPIVQQQDTIGIGPVTKVDLVVGEEAIAVPRFQVKFSILWFVGLGGRAGEGRNGARFQVLSVCDEVFVGFAFF